MKAGKAKTFPYRAMLGPRLMPGLPMKFVGADGNILKPVAVGLVDSGADISTFPASWAGVLGIDLQQDCEAHSGNTAGGVTTNYFYEPGVDVIVVGKKIHLKAVFNPQIKIILLGREDFFAACTLVSFDQDKKQFTIELKP